MLKIICNVQVNIADNKSVDIEIQHPGIDMPQYLFPGLTLWFEPPADDPILMWVESIYYSVQAKTYEVHCTSPVPWAGKTVEDALSVFTELSFTTYIPYWN